MKSPVDGSRGRDKKRLRQLLRQGWTAEVTGSGHLKLTHPNGGFVITSQTTSNMHSRHQFERNIRQVEEGRPTR